MTFEVAPEWVHVQYAETAKFTEVYGFAGTQGAVNCEGVRFTPRGKPSKTLAVFMHPSSTLQLAQKLAAVSRPMLKEWSKTKKAPHHADWVHKK